MASAHVEAQATWERAEVMGQGTRCIRHAAVASYGHTRDGKPQWSGLCVLSRVELPHGARLAPRASLLLLGAPLLPGSFENQQ
ncbi:MAG: hypothetical protein AB7N91_29635 [Candidatus Tectimicrobiota bacterium]